VATYQANLIADPKSQTCGLAFDEMQTGPWGYGKRLQFVEQVIRRKFPERPLGSIRLLDVGCGNGSLLALPLAQAGFDLTGIDLHGPSIERASQLADGLPNAHFFLCPVEDLTEPAFEVVVLSEVLEHVIDPGALLQASVKHLLRDGILIVTVPNGYGEAEIDSRIFHALHLQPGLDLVCSFLRRIVFPSRAPQNPQPPLATDNYRSGHVQFFRRRRLHQLFAQASLAVVNESAGSFICGPMVGYTFARSRRFVDWNLRVADKLPLSLVSTWYFVLRRNQDCFGV